VADVSAGFSYEVLAASGRARRGRLRTPHGVVETPAFMPVGTLGAVKGTAPEQVAGTGTQVVLANTYHLLVRPGAEVVSALGGLHRFMGWDGTILTDSGGYQVFSLASLRRVDDEGVLFQSHVDGAEIHLTPELAMRTQNLLGGDIVMVLDECPPLPAQREAVEQAVARTLAWAGRCRAAHERADQALYGIVQGGLDVGLRERCLAGLEAIGFDGYALGGLSVGEPPERMYALLEAFADTLPADRPRYLMGVGTPRDLVRAVGAGVDQFDCVLPTRNGRKGYAFTSGGAVRLRNACHRVCESPLDAACRCYTCGRFSRGYLRHLIMVGEVLGSVLVSLHNIHFYQSLMCQMREAIERDAFDAWRSAFERSPACIGARSDE
jgi:queuine tRNA-ribosyltransferase